MTDAELRRVFAANLQRLMDATPALDSGPKLEAKSGVGTSSISRYMLGQSAPTLDTLAAIAKAFGVQPWELLVDEKTSAQDIVNRLLGRR